MSTSRKKSGKPRKKLLDLLVLRFPEQTREWLYARVLHGDVWVNGHREKQPGAAVASDAQLHVEGLPGHPDSGEASKPWNQSGGTLKSAPSFVSRGGFKLDSVLEKADFDGFHYHNRVILDAGASTGGFTDCLLKRGAATIHAVDVGYNQLDYRLRRDPRVHVRERCNIMSIQPGELEPPPELAVADLSFRSMEGVARHILQLTSGKLLLALLKPQFELEYSDIQIPEFSGVISDENIALQILENTFKRLFEQGVEVKNHWPSGLKGGQGNQEYFALLALNREPLQA